MAFKDIRPAAATHLLVIPKEHIVNTASLRPAEDLELGRCEGRCGSVRVWRGRGRLFWVRFGGDLRSPFGLGEP